MRKKAVKLLKAITQIKCPDENKRHEYINDLKKGWNKSSHIEKGKARKYYQPIIDKIKLDKIKRINEMNDSRQ